MMNGELDIDDKIMLCIVDEYKSVTDIAQELNEPRNKIQVHVFKLREKWKMVIGIANDNGDAGVQGMKYKTRNEAKRELIRRCPVAIKKLNL